MQCSFNEDKIQGKGHDPIRGDYTVTGEMGTKNNVFVGQRQENGKTKDIALHSFEIDGSKVLGLGEDERGQFKYSGSMDEDHSIEFTKTYLSTNRRAYYRGVISPDLTNISGYWRRELDGEDKEVFSI